MSTRVLLLVVPFFLSALCVDSCRSPEAANLIILNFYTTPTQFEVYNVNNFHEILNHPQFIRTRNTVIYHYGFTQTPETASVVEVIQAYLSRGNVNVVLVNYASVVTNTLPNACTLGESIATMLVRFFDGGYNPSQVHLVGFSFGSTVFGIAGREVILRSNNAYTIERITGLDPGQIQSLFLPLTGRLGPGDARFVDTIHTEAVGFGDLETRGDVQYFVNGGVTQPQCTSSINTIAQTCSHLFAATIWIESISASSPIFPALQCNSWQDFLVNNCNSNAPIGNVGVLTSTAVRGSYFLRTNLEAPFSRPVPGP